MSDEWKKKEELHKNSECLKEIQILVMDPQTIYCQSETEEEVEPQQHTIQVTKVYVFINKQGREFGGAVFCPVHNRLVSVNVDHRHRSGSVLR